MADLIRNCAAGLRRLGAPQPVQVIAVTGGKGGVGKTSVAVNLSMAMAIQGKKVLLLDGALGLANVDVMLGLQPSYNLAHVLAGECSLEETVIEAARNLWVVPSSSGKRHMTDLSPAQHAGLVQVFSDLRLPLDVLVIDTSAGITDSVLAFSQASQQIIVVLTDDPASITDAYALIKLLHYEQGIDRIHVLSNRVQSAAEGRETYENLQRVVGRFLDVTLIYLGAVPQDESLRRAVRGQRAVVDIYPECPASLAFHELAGKALAWGPPPGARGNLEFFVERLVQGVGA